VIIELNGGLSPFRLFIWGSRQRGQQWQFFIAEDFIPAPIFLLERAMAEIFQFLPDCLI